MIDSLLAATMKSEDSSRGFSSRDEKSLFTPDEWKILTPPTHPTDAAILGQSLYTLNKDTIHKKYAGFFTAISGNIENPSTNHQNDNYTVLACNSEEELVIELCNDSTRAYYVVGLIS